MKNIRLLVKHIYCSGCSQFIESELKKKGVTNVKIKLGDSDVQKMYLQYNQNVKRKEILNLLEKRGIELISIK